MALPDEDVESISRTRWIRGGPIVVIVLGASLWAQLLAMGFGSEVRIAGSSPWLLIGYVAPLAVLVAGMFFRSTALALLFFPLSLLPGIAALPEPDRLMFHDGWAMARVAATLAIYLAVTGAWFSGARRVHVEVERLDDSDDEGGASFRNYAFTRLAPLLLLFGVPTYGIYLDPAIVGTIAQNYAGHEVVAQIFLSLVMFFVWCVVAYTMFLVPALNVEYDRRNLSRRLDAMTASIQTRKIWYRLGAWGLGVGLSFLLLLLLV